MLMHVWYIILFVLYLLNIISHTIGFSLLVKVYRNGSRTPEELFLMTLSISDVLKNVLRVLIIAPVGTFIGKTAGQYIGIILNVGVFLVYILNLFYILIDKFLQVYLHTKYSLYVSVKRTKYLLITTWCFVVVICATCMVYYGKTHFEFENLTTMDVYLSIDVCFFLLACFIYSYIFFKYKQARRPLSQSSRYKSQHIQQHVFCKSRFTVSVLITLSYVILNTIPDIIGSIYRFFNNDVPYKGTSWPIAVVCFICYAISDLLDSWAYIFLHLPVRKFLRRKFRDLIGRSFETQKRNLSISSAVIVSNEMTTQF